MPRAGLLAVCAALAACAGGTETQVVTGQISAARPIAVRAIDGQDVVTAAQVRSDGSFTLALPSGNRYRIEVLTAAGVKHLYTHGDTGLHDLAFKVCKPVAPWDVGAIEPPGSGTKDTCDPTKDEYCKCDPGGTCGGGEGGGTCDPKTDPTCKCDPSGKCTGGGGTGGGGCDPKTDPTCKCDPSGKCTGGGGGTGGGTCDPKADPTCKCDPTGKCTSDCTDPKDPSCKPVCDASTGKDCAPPPCKDPTDPNTCKDECAIEPSGCGCPKDDAGCWGDPYPPKCDADGNCSAEGALMPDHPPTDFGCGEPG
jgi:hypothetical protein